MMPKENAKTTPLAPERLQGDWTATEIMGEAVTRDRRAARMSLVHPGDPTLSLPPFPANGGFYDGCNGGGLYATFGSGQSIRITQTNMTLMACTFTYQISMAFTQARTWDLHQGSDGQEHLRLYSGDHNVTADFVRTEPNARPDDQKATATPK